MSSPTIFNCAPKPLSQIGGSPSAPVLKPTYAATIVIDPNLGYAHEIAAVNATSANCTLTTATGQFGQLMCIEIKSTGATTTTFGTNFSSVGTVILADATKCSVLFKSDGTTFNEVSRSRPIALTSSAIVGTATNDAATAGNIGEFVQTLVAVGAPVSLTTATAKTIASISLTAGDWDVSANVNLTMGSATTAVTSAFTAGISTTDNTLPTDGSEVECGGMVATTSSFKFGIPINRKRISVATITTVYMIGLATFSAGTAGGYGVINARRVR